MERQAFAPAAARPLGLPAPRSHALALDRRGPDAVLRRHQRRARRLGVSGRILAPARRFLRAIRAATRPRLDERRRLLLDGLVPRPHAAVPRDQSARHHDFLLSKRRTARRHARSRPAPAQRRAALARYGHALYVPALLRRAARQLLFARTRLSRSRFRSCPG